MTREEAIERIKVHKIVHKMNDPRSIHVSKALDMAIKALEQEERWIPVSERLPEENITVIGITKFDDVYKTELYDDCGKKKWYANCNFDVPIVAWIPFPEQPCKKRK